MDRLRVGQCNCRNLRIVAVVGAVLVVLPTTGCIGLASVLMHAWNGQIVEPAYDGLKGKQVAVVCTGNSAAYGPSPIVDSVAYSVEKLLASNVPDIKMIPLKDVDEWKDENDWDELDFIQIGEGVGADMVVAIEIDSFTLHDGQTMYKGRAGVTTTVVDVKKGGADLYRHMPSQIVFPTNGALSATDTTDSKFRRQFILYISHQIAKHFYAYDVKDDYARDTTLIY